MTELTRFQVAGAEPVIVETDGPDGPRPASGRRPVREAHAEFTARLDAIGDAVAVSLHTLRGNLRPDGMTVTFGVTMSAEAGAVIARTAQEATIQVHMVWSRDGQEPAGSTGTGP